MTPYEKVFHTFVAELDRTVLLREAHTFYVNQVRIILGWTDLADSRLITEIRRLDQAYRTVVEPMKS